METVCVSIREVIRQGASTASHMDEVLHGLLSLIILESELESVSVSLIG